MNRTGEAQPYLSFCLIVRNAADTLEACLKSLRDRAPEAEIVIVDTCSSDLPTGDESNNGPYDLRYPKTHQIARRFADVWEEYKGPRGDWSREMYAFDDAAAARNRSFELATGKWVCWVDADDVIVGAEEAERLLKLNNRWRPGRQALVMDIAQAEKPISLIDKLRFVEENLPQVEGFRCPYLYQAREDGTAITWQERERIVRNNGKWVWQRPAHEVLVPKNVQDFQFMFPLAHLLFVHKKQFTAEDRAFSVNRHFNILIKEYDRGERHVQGLLYLENFSIFLCPQRRPEFIRAAYEAANTNVDRARALIRAGNFAAEQGFYWDAMESFSGATAIAPDFPDCWAAGGNAFEQADNPLKAAEWFVRAVNSPTDCSVSDINPRQQAIEFRVRAAVNLFKGSKRFVAGKRNKDAITVLEQATELCRQAMEHPAIAGDRAEGAAWMNLFANELNALRMAEHIGALHAFLVANDETRKAMLLLSAVPHNLEDHPTIVDLQKWAEPMAKHLTDPEAYRKFYDEIGTDVVSIETGLEYDSAMQRVKFLVNWLREHKPTARILEVGSFDGITALPVLRALPGVSYVAVETKQDAIDRLVARAEKFGVADRLTTSHGLLVDPTRLDPGSFDVVIFYEVIEHVPDPVESVARLLSFLKPDGKLFLSTPWGAFDRGAPMPMPPQRDPRGHVRAFMPREFVEAVEEAGGRVLELAGDHQQHNYGDTMYLIAEKTVGTRDYRARRGVAFYVPSALWDWNASHVEKTGIGASEETIVCLARHIGLYGRDVEVFGPLPTSTALVDEEVRNGVKYWRREKLRHLHPEKTLVVSRAPSIGAVIPHEDKILWLQDAWYPDLNAEVSKAYRKIVVLTDFHRRIMNKNHDVPLDKMEICENFLLAEHFDGTAERSRSKFVYASSPDRGLINLLKLWPDIRKAIPDAELHIFYGWDGCMKLGSYADPGWTDRYRKIRTQFLELRYQPGIVERGRVNHVTLAREFKSAAAWLYPTAFDETGCLTAAKALAGGCVPVCSPRAALVETAKSAITRYVPMPDNLDPVSNGVGVEHHPEWAAYASDFVSAVIAARQVPDVDRQAAATEAIEKYRLATIWPKWRELLRR